MTSATTITKPTLAARYGSIGIGAVAAALVFAGKASRQAH